MAECCKDGALAGTVGKAKRLEAIKISLSGMTGYAVQYRTQVQTYGWQNWVTTSNGTAIDKAALSGTVGKAKRLEAIEIRIVKEVKTWTDGQYKVGSAIPAGKYVIYPTDNDGAYFELNKDTTGNPSSIITNDIFSGREILTVSDGQYLTIENGKMYAYADAPKVDTSKGTLSDGMYEVGVDVPAGQYTLNSTSKDEEAYYEIDPDCSHDVSSIIPNGFFTGNRYVTLTAGEYIKIEGCVLKLK